MKPLKERYGDWALVTGATSGIGKALSQRFAEEGLNMVLVARNPENLAANAQELKDNFNIEVRTVSVDLSIASETAKLITEVSDLNISVFVPCAAIETKGYFVEDDLKRHESLLELDVRSPMILAYHFGAQMASRGRGSILFVSSMSGWMPQPYMAHYGAAKAYILNLGHGLHHEMKDKGVDVSVLSPGPTDTPMAAGTGIDFASMGMAVMSPDDVARVGINALGMRPDAVPGFRNRMMGFMMTRLMSRRIVGAMMKMMMGKALNMQS